MLEHRVEHRLDVAADRYWELFLFDEAFRRALYDHLALKIEYLDVTRLGDEPSDPVRRELHIVPDRQIPGALAALVRGMSLVKERSRYDPRQKTLEVAVELPVIGKLVDFSGRYSSRELSGSSFVRVWEGRCRARLPLVGRQIERYLLRELERSFELNVAFTRRWLAQRRS